MGCCLLEKPATAAVQRNSLPYELLTTLITLAHSRGTSKLCNALTRERWTYEKL